VSSWNDYIKHKLEGYRGFPYLFPFRFAEHRRKFMDTITLLALLQDFGESHGGFHSFATTTNITTDQDVISTALTDYDNSEDDFFKDWWLWINTIANATKLKKVTAYTSTSGTLTVDGVAYSSESAAATCYLFKYNRDQMKEALIQAEKDIFPTLYKRVDNQTLSTGNILRDGHLEEWSSTSALTYWTVSNVTLTRTINAGSTRGGTYSAHADATAANGNISVSSNTFPELLQLQGKTVNAYAMANAETLDDATIIIDTVSKDGTTTQTLTSTTSCPAGYWTRIEFESQTLNDDLQEIKFTLNTATSGEYVIWDNVWFGSQQLSEYLLPLQFVDGHVSQAFVQTRGHEDPIMYDLSPFTENKGEQFNYEIYNDGAYKYIRIPKFPNKRLIRLKGYEPLEALSADSDTITLETEKAPLLISKAAEKLYEYVIDPLINEIERFRADMTSITTNIATADTAIVTLDTAQATFDTGIVTIVGTIDGLAAGIVTDTTALDALVVSAATAGSEDIAGYDEQIERLDKKITRQRTLKADLDEQIQRDRSSKKDNDEQRQRLQEKRQRYDEDLKRLDERIQRLNEVIGFYNNKLLLSRVKTRELMYLGMSRPSELVRR